MFEKVSGNSRLSILAAKITFVCCKDCRGIVKASSSCTLAIWLLTLVHLEFHTSPRLGLAFSIESNRSRKLRTLRHGS
jgi:hypothetical protein